MAGNGVPDVNFKGFMAFNARTSWNAVRKIYSEVDPSLPMVGREHTCRSYWYVRMNKMI